MKRLSTLAALTAIAAFSAGNVSASSLFGNTGFEDGTGTDADIWIEAGSAPGERDSSNPNSGSFAMKLEAVGSPTAGANSVVLQNSIADNGLPSLQELTAVDVSFQWAGDYGPGGVARVNARILNGAGNIIVNETVALPDNNSVYEEIIVPTLDVPAFGADPNDTYALFVEILTEAGAFDGSTAVGYVDDFVATGTLVPEPSSLALLGLGGLAAFRRRRRA